MTLEKSWELVNFYLAHIATRTTEMRRNFDNSGALFETLGLHASIIREIDLATSELSEALRLSQQANERLLNLFSDRRKGVQDEQSVR